MNLPFNSEEDRLHTYVGGEKSRIAIETLMNYAKAYLLKGAYERDQLSMTIKDDRPDRMIVEIILGERKVDYIYDKKERADNIAELDRLFFETFRNVKR
jgi:hypothetical protein